MRRLISSSVLALAAIAALAGSAWAASAPVISSVSPTQVGIGGTLTIKGKNFKKGVKNNRVFFIRGDGKTVRARPSKASSTRQMSVKVPSALEQFLTVKDGVATATRFHIQVLSGKFSKKTSTAKSPLVFPAGSAPTTPGNPGTTPGTTPPPPPDCDGDGTPDASDTDDDNDGLSDDLEAQIKTNPCAKDTDGDGVEDGYEYWSARDLNGNATPYAGKRPYPNPLDGTDAKADFDGDGLSMTEEFQAWNAYGGRTLPTGDGQSFPYSDGNQTSTAPNGAGKMDLNENGTISDEEKDADGDGLPNWIELAEKESPPVGGSGCQFVPSTGPNTVRWNKAAANIYTDCGLGAMPNGNTFTGPVDGHLINGAVAPAWVPNPLNWLDPDSDGDGIPDGADDQDFDGFSNIEEITAGGDGYFTIPQDPCDPNPDARACPTHPSST